SGTGVPELMEQALQRVPFVQLGKAQHYLLVDQFDRVRGRYFNRYFLDVTEFKAVQCSRDELGAVYVIPWFVRDVVSEDLMSLVRLTFKQWIEAEPVRPLNQGHARYAAFGTAPPTMYDDPLTVGRYPQDGLPVLLDGYHRAVRFWTKNEAGARNRVCACLICRSKDQQVRAPEQGTPGTTRSSSLRKVARAIPMFCANAR